MDECLISNLKIHQNRIPREYSARLDPTKFFYDSHLNATGVPRSYEAAPP
jgi:hypothetical protein